MAGSAGLSGLADLARLAGVANLAGLAGIAGLSGLAGLPGLSLPVTMCNDHLPIGVQLTAAAFNESKLLQVAHQMEQLISFKGKPSNV